VASLILAAGFAAACSAPGATLFPRATRTPVSDPPVVEFLSGRGVLITGHGSAITEPIEPQFSGGITVGISVVSATHEGRSKFLVRATHTSQSEVLVNTQGKYQGERPLVVTYTVVFEVTADGAWSLRVEPARQGGQPAFSGTGDRVSPFFNPPQPQTWALKYDGQAPFSANAHCVGGSNEVLSRPGAFDESVMVSLPRGPCLWEVVADGNWSLRPAP